MTVGPGCDLKYKGLMEVLLMPIPIHLPPIFSAISLGVHCAQRKCWHFTVDAPYGFVLVVYKRTGLGGPPIIADPKKSDNRKSAGTTEHDQNPWRNLITMIYAVVGGWRQGCGSRILGERFWK